MAHVPECLAIFKAMVPRSLVRLYVPNKDLKGRPIPVRQIVSALRREISRMTGGQTTYAGSGDYTDSSGVTRDERTAVIETFLPRTITDAMRRRLIQLFVDFGRTHKQEVVLVGVGACGYKIPTAHLLVPSA